MKICYIISTCDNYIETRVKYQMQHMFNHINMEDIYYLTSKPAIDKRQFGWNSLDDPKNITWKYIHFIYNMENILNYDWYVFIDDDTFVFFDNLINLLSKYDRNENYYIGHELDHIKRDFCVYMSGGAGYAISNSLYNIIFKYVKETGINNSYEHWCDDLCIGLWINKLKNNNTIHQIDNKNFHIALHNSDEEFKDAITFHKVMDEEQYKFYNSIVKEKEKVNIIENNLGLIDKTVFVLLTDLKYFNKCKRTIIDLRSKGEWVGDIVLITIDFDLNVNFKEFYNIIEAKFPQIDKSKLLLSIGENGFSNSDKREINKLNQWEKLHVFDDYFLKWSRVVFLDAGLRILDNVKYLLELNYKNKILAPTDGKYYENQIFGCQLSYDNSETVEMVKSDFGENVLISNYFLNCIWIYDTNILNLCSKNQMIEAMNKYTLCRTNEMGIMNLLLRFKYNLWEPFPFKINDKKILFDWCELNNPNTDWRDYCYIKYPVTISFDDC